MEKIVTYSPDHCFMCSELMGELKCDLNSCTAYSERSLSDLICKFLERIRQFGVIKEFLFQLHLPRQLSQKRSSLTRAFVKVVP